MTDYAFLDAALEIATRIVTLVDNHRKLVEENEEKRLAAEEAGDGQLEEELAARGHRLMLAEVGLFSAMNAYSELVI